MERQQRMLSVFTGAILLLMVTAAWTQQSEQPADKTLSPYFFVKSEDPEVDQLPLESTSVVVNIAGVIADVRVTQVYTNEGERPLEAIYTFPASTRAAVYGMQMRIGARTIVAQIRKREEARQEYEKAKEEGKSASLLEQQRPNVFQMNVANILPGDTISVELQYTELLVPTEGVYEFVYPTVVGPRYSNQPAATAPSDEGWVETPYHHEGEAPTYTFDLTVNLATGLPVQEVACTSHEVEIEYDSPSLATVKLSESEEYGGNRDYILQYRLSGDEIESGLLLYQGEEESFFLLMVQPPRRVDTDQISPREYVFIVDVSGSMHGFPLSISKQLLRDLLSHLRPMDYFNVLLFAGGSAALSEQSLPATEENIIYAIDVIDNQRGGGGTELLPALRRALALPRAGEGYARTVVIATDGYVTVEVEAFDLMRERLGDANMFAFGIGSSVNRHLIEGMAHVGMGEPFVITDPEEAPAQAERFRQYIESPVLTQIEMDFGTFDVYDVEPPGIPDVLAERPVVIFGKWRGQPRGQVMLGGQAADRAYTATVNVDNVTPIDTNAALRYLWARHRIVLLADYNRLRQNDARIEEITELGLTYNLLTAYTSFVAVDKVIRADGSEVTTVRQPLPLPEGVSDEAVGGWGSPTAVAAVDETMAMAIWFGRTFYLQDEIWVDVAFHDGIPIELYDPSADQPAVLDRFAQVRQPMIVVIEGRAYGFESTARPIRLALQQNAPNPFNASTTIRYRVPAYMAAEAIRLVIYNLAGQPVRVLIRGTVGAGTHCVVWDGRDYEGHEVASGLYFYRLETRRRALTRRMMLLR